MTKKEHSNEVILARLDGLRDLTEEKFKRTEEYHVATNNHLMKLNGQVAKNTTFRIRGSVYVAIGAILIPILISYFLK